MEKRRIYLGKVIFSGLGSARKLQSLTLKNVQDHAGNAGFYSYLNSANFRDVQNRLKELHLMITSANDRTEPGNDIEMPACHQGFGDDLPRLWLIPTTSQLTRLTIYGSRRRWGLWPFVDLRKIPTFTQLKSLSL